MEREGGSRASAARLLPSRYVVFEALRYFGYIVFMKLLSRVESFVFSGVPL